MPQGFALTNASSVEVIAAYGSPQTKVLAVAETPGWQVLGAFYLPRSCTARLDALMHVSDASLTCRVRLYDVTDGVATAAARVVPGLAVTQATKPTRVLGPRVDLEGGHTYQVQCEVVGDSGDDMFGVIPTVTITG